ncbi:hypothetical protein [Bordetella trematum]|uniref:Uncharacterized protein n=1 Tax=Bordetella trematum TaxID=123899 RepID=A0A157SND4_9BORD|nr:hypothetical protein [Bordetella trematum]SAI71980.1 Uncharacterised protein [Bordetella trematum]
MTLILSFPRRLAACCLLGISGAAAQAQPLPMGQALALDAMPGAPTAIRWAA